MATSHMDIHYNRGYQRASKTGATRTSACPRSRSGTTTSPKGGMWDRSEAEDKYLAGFMDAMKTLGVVK